jgi:hypothetical protein
MSYDQVSLVTYPLARSAYEYMMRLKDLGALEGALGEMQPIPSLLPLIDALHTILSGGEVSITLVHRGNPDIVHELEQKLAQSNADANQINAKSGYYVTIGVP